LRESHKLMPQTECIAVLILLGVKKLARPLAKLRKLPHRV
jgi:hypothetical protein